jgi:DNA-binding transcriptional LysR family regulator
MIAMSYLVQLRSFVRVFQTGSITAAARQMNLAQPSVTSHIRMLESYFARPLFIRKARGVVPTAAAEDLAKKVMPHIDALEFTLDQMTRRSAGIGGTVHIVGPGEYLSEKIAPILPLLCEEQIDIRLQIGNRQRIYNLLDNKECDIAVVASTPKENTHGYVEIDSENLILVASTEIAERMIGANYNPAVLLQTPFVSYSENLPLIDTVFNKVFGGVPGLRPAITAPDLRLLHTLVLEGVGWSVLPDYLCRKDLAAGQLIQIDLVRPPLENKIYLTWVKGALSTTVTYVRDYIVNLADKGVFR